MTLFPYNKPFSPAMILFFWFPATVILILAIRFWWITLILLFIVSSFLQGLERERSTQANELKSTIIEHQLCRRDAMVDLLYQIGKPDLPSGDYSCEKKEMWKVYNQLRDEDETLRNEERKTLVEIEMRRR